MVQKMTVLIRSDWHLMVQKMTVLITSDWHLNDKPRDRYRHDWQKQLRALIKKYEVDVVLMLGDITDDFDNHSSQLVNEVVGHLTALRDCRDTTVSIYLMRGNHDCVDPTNPFFKFASHLPDITWINSPCIRTHEGSNFLFLPHTRDYKADWADIKFSKADICFAHNTFAGTISESGHELGGVPPAAIPKDLTVISGDIHKPQDVQHITYVGSPYTVDFGDNFEPRVLLLTDGKIKSIPCRGPQKRLITAPTADATIARLKTAGDDLVKLRVTVAAGEMANWPAMKRTIIEEANKLGVHLHAIEAIMDAPRSATKRYSVTAKTKRDDEVVQDYCRVHRVEKDLEAEGLGIIEEK